MPHNISAKIDHLKFEARSTAVEQWHYQRIKQAIPRPVDLTPERALMLEAGLDKLAVDFEKDVILVKRSQLVRITEDLSNEDCCLYIAAALHLLREQNPLDG